MERYAFGEAVVWPSQQLLAVDLGYQRTQVNRAIARLVRKGYVRIIERRWSPRSGWLHNVYELLEAFAVDRTAANRIVARSRRRAWKQRYSARYEQVHTNRREYPIERYPKADPRCRNRRKVWWPGLVPLGLLAGGAGLSRTYGRSPTNRPSGESPMNEKQSSKERAMSKKPKKKYTKAQRKSMAYARAITSRGMSAPTKRVTHRTGKTP